MRLRIFAMLICGGAVLGACAGREANPVSLTRATDGVLTCPLMVAEIQANNNQARQLTGEQSDKSGRNIAVTVVGVLLSPPLLFALDLKGAQRAEINALRSRNVYLAQLMATKKCANIPTVAPGPGQTVQQRIKDAERSGKQPRCKDVGGYTAYKKKTGNICRLD